MPVKHVQENIQENSLVNKLPIMSSASNQVGHTNNENNRNVNLTPTQCGTSSSSITNQAMPSSQSFIAGDVALTPTHSSFTPQALNPHSAMTAITPMVSGTNQAKNSIKVQ